MTTNANASSSPGQESKKTTWPLRRVGLKVLDLNAAVDYYKKLGLAVVRDESGKGTVSLGFGPEEVLVLRELPGGRLRPPRTAGLYHFALLLPSEEALGSFLRYSVEQNIPIDGAADHLVSQALYLSDPEGNGIEVYADRPSESWRWNGSEISMATLPLRTRELLNLARPFEGFPTSSRLGHMHLNVGNLDRSREFYQSLSMDATARIPNQAYFMSWDRYHHHLGLNVWNGRNARPVEPDVSGLDFYEIARPGLKPGVYQDPDGVTVIVSPAE
jgi:catechol 2,3-dioxygenase